MTSCINEAKIKIKNMLVMIVYVDLFHFKIFLAYSGATNIIATNVDIKSGLIDKSTVTSPHNISLEYVKNTIKLAINKNIKDNNL
jgi:hypothetical protein